MDNFTARELIKHLGGAIAVAKLCETSGKVVTMWYYRGIPKPRMQYLRAVRRKEIAALEASKKSIEV